MITPQRFLASMLGLAVLTGVYTSEVQAETKNTLKYDSKTSKFIKAITPDKISHFSIYSGPSLTGDGNPNDSVGAENTRGQRSWHQVSLQYKINDRFKFVFNPRFTMEFGKNDPDRQRFGIDNPVFGLQGLWYKNGNFTFSGGVNTVAATLTESAREQQQYMNPGGFNAVNYKVNNKVDVGSWLWARHVRKFRANGVNGFSTTDTPIFVAPYTSYTVNDKLSFTAYYQYNGSFTAVDTVQIDADDEFGFITAYTLNKYLTIQPIIQLFRASDFDVTSGNLNFWISGRFF